MSLIKVFTVAFNDFLYFEHMLEICGLIKDIIVCLHTEH